MGMGIFTITNTFDKTCKIEPEVEEKNNLTIEEPTAIVVDKFPRRKVISYLFTDKARNAELNIPYEDPQSDNIQKQVWLM
jgi:hypothetical protein